jgi:HK97 gp10 family phage protein
MKVAVTLSPAAARILEKHLNVAADVFAQEVLARAKETVPVDTGDLQASIYIAETSDGAAIGSNLEYAPYVEFGTIYMTPNAFLRRAVTDVINKHKPGSK